MRSEFAKRAATFLAMVVAGYFLGTYLDQHFTSDDSVYLTAASDTVEAAAPATLAAACVGTDGSWKNWSWPNVPTLSPKCDNDG